MARRLFSAGRALLPPVPAPTPAPLPASSSAVAAAAESLLPLLPCKRRKKLLKKLRSPRVAPIEPEPDRRVPALDAVLDRDAAFRFLSRARSYMASLPPPHRIPLAEAGKMHRELGFPRGRSVTRAAARHPLVFHRLTQCNFIKSFSFSCPNTTSLSRILQSFSDLFDADVC